MNEGICGNFSSYRSFKTRLKFETFLFNTHLVGRVGLVPGEEVEFTLFLDDERRPQARKIGLWLTQRSWMIMFLVGPTCYAF